jgi:cell division protein FtsA
VRNKNKIIVGLEVGTSKVCAVAGDLSPDGVITVIGVGQSASQGVRKGEVVDIEAASQSIHAAVADAEESANVEIHSVIASVTGGHIRSFNSRGMVAITTEDGVITKEEVEAVLRNAKAVSLPPDHAVIHAIRQHFFVDGHDGITNPIGMSGSRLEADVHVVHGVRTRLTNAVRCIRHVPLEVENIVLGAFSSALALLSPQQQQLGAIVIDIGGGTTDYIVYAQGTVKHSGVLAVGGDHVTNDIAYGLRIPINRAEQLKIEHGSVLADDTTTTDVVALKREVGLPEQVFPKATISRIMRLRVEETLTLVKKEIEKQKLLDFIGEGVFLTGGSSQIRGIQQLAAEIFHLPVHMAPVSTVGGPKSVLEGPQFATAVGLLKYAQFAADAHEQAPRARFGQRFTKIFQKLRGLM